MKRTGLLTVFLIAVFFAGLAEPYGSIKQFISNRPDGSYYEINSDYLHAGKDLSAFYENRNYTLAWFDNNTLSNSGYEMLDFIIQSGLHGLQPEDYHLAQIRSYVGKFLCYYMPSDQSDVVNLDLLLTDAFLLMGAHLYNGKVNPGMEGVTWNLERKARHLQLADRLKNAIDSNNVSGVLNRLAPVTQPYLAMKENLAFFLSIRELPWAKIITRPPVKPGDTNQVLPLIRERLILLRYRLSDSSSEVFDTELEQQVKLFQKDWGLNTDGVIGKTTLEDLNFTPGDLISRLKVNMERFRWLQADRVDKYIIVNIADFRLNMIKGSDTLISMRAIVGKEPRNTPVFSERLTYIVFNPTWTVPETILKNDVIPELLKGPQYLEKKKMKLFRPDGTELSYADVDWTTISKSHFPYSVRQESGPGNSLGKVKFMFPNTYDVYIHDTPSRELFTRDNRAVSSGCVRVEKPFDLAVLLLSDTPEWSSENIRKTMENQREQAVRLKTPVDVILVYLTAWTNGKERIQFRNDVYKKDNILLAALEKKQGIISGNSILW